MKINNLSEHQKETLEYIIKIHSLNGIREDLQIPPTEKQMRALRCDGYVIGENQELLRLDDAGMLRECYQGIPCRHSCIALAEKRCSQREFPSCGMATGACLATKIPCNSDCQMNFFI